MKSTSVFVMAAVSAAGIACMPALANSDASRSAGPDRANPDSYDMSATFGANTVRMVLATTNGKREYSTLLNGKVVASAVAQAAGGPDQMAAYVTETAKVLTGAGADPAQFGVSMLSPVSYTAQPEIDAAKLKKALGSKVGDDMISKQLTGTLSD